MNTKLHPMLRYVFNLFSEKAGEFVSNFAMILLDPESLLLIDKSDKSPVVKFRAITDNENYSFFGLEYGNELILSSSLTMEDISSDLSLRFNSEEGSTLLDLERCI